MKFALHASDHMLAQSTHRRFVHAYDFVDEAEADVILVLGGDGALLKTLRHYPHTPVYGMNCGTVGFLMNNFEEDFDALLNKVRRASTQILHPLKMTAKDTKGKVYGCHGINEISLIRGTSQAGKIKISVDGRVRMEELSCDGILLATPAGSTAYNLSAHGPIIPLGANLLALTPISPFRPRRWKGALLPDTSVVELEVLDPTHRKMRASCDEEDIDAIAHLHIVLDKDVSYALLFDPDHHLEERIIAEQFFS